MFISICDNSQGIHIIKRSIAMQHITILSVAIQVESVAAFFVDVLLANHFGQFEGSALNSGISDAKIGQDVGNGIAVSSGERNGINITLLIHIGEIDCIGDQIGTAGISRKGKSVQFSVTDIPFNILNLSAFGRFTFYEVVEGRGNLRDINVLGVLPFQKIERFGERYRNGEQTSLRQSRLVNGDIQTKVSCFGVVPRLIRKCLFFDTQLLRGGIHNSLIGSTNSHGIFRHRNRLDGRGIAEDYVNCRFIGGSHSHNSFIEIAKSGDQIIYAFLLLLGQLDGSGFSGRFGDGILRTQNRAQQHGGSFSIECIFDLRRFGSRFGIGEEHGDGLVISCGNGHGRLFEVAAGGDQIVSVFLLCQFDLFRFGGSGSSRILPVQNRAQQHGSGFGFKCISDHHGFRLNIGSGVLQDDLILVAVHVHNRQDRLIKVRQGRDVQIFINGNQGFLRRRGGRRIDRRVDFIHAQDVAHQLGVTDAVEGIGVNLLLFRLFRLRGLFGFFFEGAVSEFHLIGNDVGSKGVRVEAERGKNSALSGIGQVLNGFRGGNQPIVSNVIRVDCDSKVTGILILAAQHVDGLGQRQIHMIAFRYGFVGGGQKKKPISGIFSMLRDVCSGEFSRAEFEGSCF